jgi:hypothetical protein
MIATGRKIHFTESNFSDRVFIATEGLRCAGDRLVGWQHL